MPSVLVVAPLPHPKPPIFISNGCNLCDIHHGWLSWYVLFIIWKSMIHNYVMHCKVGGAFLPVLQHGPVEPSNLQLNLSSVATACWKLPNADLEICELC